MLHGIFKPGIFLILFAIVAASACGSYSAPVFELSDYPERFSEDAAIIVRSSASDVELGAAAEIASKLAVLTENEPEIICDTDALEQNALDSNLILIATPDANEVLKEVYRLTDATEITGEYPGPGKAVLETTTNPWNSSKGLLIVGGSSESGVIAASAMITDDDSISELNGRIMASEFVEDWVGVSSFTVTRTSPSGYLEVWVSPGDISANAGDETDVRCYVMPLINTPVEISSIELAVFDSQGSLISEQPMARQTGNEANLLNTVAGDEASYKIRIDFSINPLEPEYFSEYTSDSFQITVQQ